MIMQSFLQSRVTLVWLGLLSATALSLLVGHGAWISDPRHAGIVILIVAFVKSRFIVMDFMELRNSPRYMRVAAESWLVLVCAVLVALFLARHHDNRHASTQSPSRELSNS
jgi:hypothetical protein